MSSLLEKAVGEVSYCKHCFDVIFACENLVVIEDLDDEDTPLLVAITNHVNKDEFHFTWLEENEAVELRTKFSVGSDKLLGAIEGIERAARDARLALSSAAEQ